MNSVSTAIIDRVKKLLALSQSSNAHESALALAKANAIIVEHQIDMVLLNSGDPTMPEVYDEQVIACSRRKPIEIKAIAWLLEEHFRCKVVYTYARLDGVLYPSMTVIGRRTDAEFGRWLVSYLREEFQRRWAAFKQEASAATREKNAFIYGVYKGLDERLRDESALVVEGHIAKIAAVNLADIGDRAPAMLPGADAPSELATRYAIAVRTEHESLEQEMRRLHPDLSPGAATGLTSTKRTVRWHPVRRRVGRLTAIVRLAPEVEHPTLSPTPNHERRIRQTPVQNLRLVRWPTTFTRKPTADDIQWKNAPMVRLPTALNVSCSVWPEVRRYMIAHSPSIRVEPASIRYARCVR